MVIIKQTPAVVWTCKILYLNQRGQRRRGHDTLRWSRAGAGAVIINKRTHYVTETFLLGIYSWSSFLRFFQILFVKKKSASRSIPHTAGEAEAIQCQDTPFSTFCRILEALRVEQQNSTPRFAQTPERRNGNINLGKYFISSSGDRTHNQSVLLRAAAARLASVINLMFLYLKKMFFDLEQQSEMSSVSHTSKRKTKKKQKTERIHVEQCSVLTIIVITII